MSEKTGNLSGQLAGFGYMECHFLLENWSWISVPRDILDHVIGYRIITKIGIKRVKTSDKS